MFCLDLLKNYTIYLTLLYAIGCSNLFSIFASLYVKPLKPIFSEWATLNFLDGVGYLMIRLPDSLQPCIWSLASVCSKPADWLHPSSLTYTETATRTCCGAICFCIICHNLSFLQNRPFWFIPLDTAMIAERIYVDQISVKQKIKTLRRVEVRGRKRNVYTPFLLYLLFVTFIK